MQHRRRDLRRLAEAAQRDLALDLRALESGVALRVTHEVLAGTWEALRDGRADLVVGATNEPPAIPNLGWLELGVIEWVFAVSPRHPLANAREPLTREEIARHRAVVVADSSRLTGGRAYGMVGGQRSMAWASAGCPGTGLARCCSAVNW